MDFWLHLPYGLEQVFWRSETTRQYLADIDTYSLIIGILGHVFTMMSMRRLMDNILTVLSGTLLVCQLVWLRCRRASYDRWRHHVTLFQSIRWLLLRYIIGVHSKGLTHVLAANVLHTAVHAPSRQLQNFLSVNLLGPVFILFGSLVHMLPWRFQVVAVTTGTGIQVWGYCNQQLRVMRAAGLEPMAQRACYCISGLLVMPMAPQHLQHVCDSNGPAMVSLFASLLVACMLPLWVSYHVEATSKRRFLRLHVWQQSLADQDQERLSPCDQILVIGIRSWLAASTACYFTIMFAETLSKLA